MKSTRAELEAERVLAKFDLHRPPVDVEALARELGAEVRYAPLEADLSALIHRRGRTPLIWVNRNDYSTRQRFSIAHELGHLLLHQEENIFVDQVLRRDQNSSRGEDFKEIQANQFAASLLMPRSWIRREVLRRLSRCGSIDPDHLTRDLAQRFEVSPEALRFRLVNLGLLGTI